MRLEALAREAGVAHPTILHHFGSRDGLLAALEREAVYALINSLLSAVQRGLPAARELVASALADEAHTRALAWICLTGRPEVRRELDDALDAVVTTYARERDGAPTALARELREAVASELGRGLLRLVACPAEAERSGRTAPRVAEPVVEGRSAAGGS